MQDVKLFTQLLGIAAPWSVESVDFDKDSGEVRIRVSMSREGLVCPECGEKCRGYDKEVREWRHLPTFQYKTVIVAEVPRVECEKHGVHRVKVPWAEPNSRFTVLMERMVIDMHKEIMCISSVAKLAGITYSEAEGIIGRAVNRGLSRRVKRQVFNIGFDEKAHKKGHSYLTIVHDKGSGNVLHVSLNRDTAAVDEFYDQWGEHLRKLRSVTMDLWKPFIEGARRHLDYADDKICFDKFHVMSFFGDAVNEVRKQEHAALSKKGNNSLKGTKFAWLYNARNIDGRSRRWFHELLGKGLKTARAWSIKELAGSLWDYVSPTWTEKAWKKLLGWMDRSRLEPMKKLSKTIKSHFHGIMNAVRLKTDNADAESINSRIERIKNRACGFRNVQNFVNAIYFHLGGLDLYPALPTR